MIQKLVLNESQKSDEQEQQECKESLYSCDPKADAVCIFILLCTLFQVENVWSY